MKRLRSLSIGIALTLHSLVMAHTDDYVDKMQAPHGGQVRMAGALHLELVVKPREVTVYVTDHSQKAISTRGATGTATVIVGETDTPLTLTPAGENALRGSGVFAIKPEMRVTLSVTLPGQDRAEASFAPLNSTANIRDDRQKH